MVNRVTLIGNLGRDPEARHLEGGLVVAKFPLATNESYRDKSGEWQTLTEWHDVVAWRGLAERVERSLKKGSLAYVEGKLTKRKWQDKDGNDRYSVEIVAQSIRFLDKRESSGSSMTMPSAGDEFPPSGQFEKAPKPEAMSHPADDDLPF